MTETRGLEGADRRLCEEMLPHLLPDVQCPSYDRSAIAPGIVHLGLGGFARSHMAVYTDDALEGGNTEWGIVGVSLHSTAMRAALVPQDGLYTVLSRDSDRASLRVVGAVLDVMCIDDQRPAIFDLLNRPHIRIVTLTVTEKGYCLDPATGGLDEAHPAILADLVDPYCPRSVPGFLAEAIRRRHEAGHPPFTVLTCDNLPQNGPLVRAAVARFAHLRDPELGRYVETHVSFPCTMVDRITPATSEADKAAVANGLGMVDAWPVVTEPFHQWVIEDRFPPGRPDWEVGGALMVDDVRPYELMKLRCLNGAHSLLAYLSAVAGIGTVADAMADPQLPKVLRRFWHDDVLPTLPPVPGTDVEAYLVALEGRFANPGIEYPTLKVASDGSQKLPQRLLAIARARLAAGGEPKVVPLAVAAWMRFLLGTDETGATYPIDDPMAERLTALAKAAGPDAGALTDALLSIRDIFGDDLPGAPAFRAAVERHLAGLLERGVAATLAAFLADEEPA